MDTKSEEEDEELVYKDGVQRAATRGRPPSVSALEQKLEEVKELYACKTGHTVHAESDKEDEELVYKDGVLWAVARGRPPSLSGLQEKLEEVKELYACKTGHTLDAESDLEDELVYKDGVQWAVTRGRPPSLSAIEQKLQEVNELYARKTGHAVDTESDEEDEEEREEEDLKCVFKDGVQ